MTRGGLSIDQKMVTDFVKRTVTNSQTLKDGFDLQGLTGETEKVSFSDSLEYLSRGLCLDLQRRERGSTSVSITKIKDELRRRGIDPDEIVKSVKEQKS